MRRLLGLTALLILGRPLPAQTDEFEYKVAHTLNELSRTISLAFCADEKTAFAGGADGVLSLVNVPDGTSRRLASSSHAMGAVDCSRDGAMGAGGAADGSIWLSRASGNAQKFAGKGGHHGRIISVKFSPKGEFLVSSGDDKGVIVWDPIAGQQLFTLPNPSKERVMLAGFSAGGMSLLGATESGDILEWDLKTRNVLRQIKETSDVQGGRPYVYSASVSFDGAVFALAKETIQLPRGWASGPIGLPRSPGGTASSSGTAGTPGPSGGPPANSTGENGHNDPSGLSRLDTLKVSALPGLSVLKSISGVDGQIISMSISADDRFLAGSRKRQKGTFLSIYNLERGIEIASLPILENSKVAEFSPNGRWLGTVSADGAFQILAVTGVGTGGGPGRIPGRKCRLTSDDRTPLVSPNRPLVLAVVDLRPLQVPPELASAVAEMVRTQISGTKNVVMVERQKMPDIQREQGFQYSDLADPSTAVKLGKMVGASKILFGSLSKVGDKYTITLSLVDVETGGVIGMRGVECAIPERDLSEAVADIKDVTVETKR
jgi:WD40 repeat protein